MSSPKEHVLLATMRKALIPILISLGSIFLALGLGEIAARALAPTKREAKNPFLKERPRLFVMPEGSSSLQDQSYEAEKPEGVFRIAVVGDSFTFAPQMQFDDSFSKRLERSLNMNKSSELKHRGARAEVINFGIPGHSTIHEVRTVEEALKLSPDLVLLQITLNDAQLRPFSLEPIEFQRKFGKAPLDYDASWLLRNSRLARMLAERLHNQRSVEAYVQYHYDLFSNPESARSFHSALDKMKAHVNAASNQKNSPRLIAVIFPLFDFPLNDSYPFLALHESIGTVLKERNIPFLDLFSRFKGLPVERLQLIPGKDSHPNEIAHRIAAEQLLAWLVRRKFIPADLVPQRVYRRRDHIKEPVAVLPFASKKRATHDRPLK